MKNQTSLFWLLGGLLFVGLCAGMVLIVTAGSGLTLWLSQQEATPQRSTRRAGVLSSAATETATATATSAPILPTPTNTFTPIPTETSLPTDTATYVPTLTPTFTPTPTETPLPTHTALPTDTATPAPTPTPDFIFQIAETGDFSTNHINFDVYIAVVDSDNHPLGGYRVIGTHSSGLQVESAVSAAEWTENSGAMHYKAGNIKYEVFTSPGGVWSLQLVDEVGTPVAPAIDFPFDPSHPQWYFLLYQRD